MAGWAFGSAGRREWAAAFVVVVAVAGALAGGFPGPAGPPRVPCPNLLQQEISQFSLSAEAPAPMNPCPGAFVFSGYLGGSGEEGGPSLDVATDALGNVYVAGTTSSADFPATLGAFDTLLAGPGDGFVAKVNANGSALIWATFLGGSGSDSISAVKLDPAGNVVVAGATNSADFPVTPGALDTSYNGGSVGNGADGFVAILSPTGAALSYSSFLGGSKDDGANDVAVDATGAIFLTGTTQSRTFPVTQGSYDVSHNGGQDAFIMKLGPSPDPSLVYSTFLGGSGSDVSKGIALDLEGSAFVTGLTLPNAGKKANFPTTPGAYDRTSVDQDVFVAKMNAAGSVLVYSTFLGGSSNSIEHGESIAVDTAGSAYVTGNTLDPNFPTTPGAFDRIPVVWEAFVTKFNPAGSALVFSTFLGGSSADLVHDLTIDSDGYPYVTGFTNSLDFPLTPDAVDSLRGSTDAFLTRLNVTGDALVYSTYLGGSTSTESGWGIALDVAGNTVIAGETNAPDFPVTSGSFDTSHNGGLDVFVSKLEP